MEQSEQIDALAAAFSKAQASVEGAVKGAVNPRFDSKYTDLASVWAACRVALTENGLAVIQSPGLLIDGKMHMTTLLTHSSGQWVRDTLSIPLSKVDAQGYGSAVTYARRYALAAIVGVSPEDDGGNAASQPARNAEPIRPISDAQFKELIALAEETGTDNRGFCKYFKIDAARELPAAKFDEAMAMLRKKLTTPTQKEAA